MRYLKDYIMEGESRIQEIKGAMLKHPEGGWYRREFEVSSF
jgi:hypothetical protein